MEFGSEQKGLVWFRMLIDKGRQLALSIQLWHLSYKYFFKLLLAFCHINGLQKPILKKTQWDVAFEVVKAVYTDTVVSLRGW